MLTTEEQKNLKILMVAGDIFPDLYRAARDLAELVIAIRVDDEITMANFDERAFAAITAFQTIEKKWHAAHDEAEKETQS
jgi:hypothetical protein